MTEQTTPRPIVVAVDFSQESEAALMSAAELANREPDTPIVVLHVAHEPAHKPGFYHRRGRGESLLPIEYLARRALTEFMAEMRLQYPEIAQLQNVQEMLQCQMTCRCFRDIPSTEIRFTLLEREHTLREISLTIPTTF